MSEHDFEPIRGLPGDLPEGEKILWQGAPDPLTLATRAFHGGVVATYFGALMVWRAGGELLAGGGAMQTIASAAGVLPLALLGLGLVGGLAWLNARTSVYTITNKRVVLRFGIAIPKAINIPFAIIGSAALKAFANDTGDIAVTLKAPNKIAFLMLWPHARPWRLSRPEPTLRSVAGANAIAGILADALRAYGATADGPAQTVVPVAPKLALA
jgi:hypothetical protein